MEEWLSYFKKNVLQRLNPYYNGRYSWSFIFSALYLLSKTVLILIIMEDTHGGPLFTLENACIKAS